MADGVTPPQATYEVATDDCGADGHAQILKLAISSDGSPTLIPATAANGLLVDLARAPSVSAAEVDQVASSASSVTLEASNSSRKGLYIFNDSTAALYVKFGATASATSYTVKIGPGEFWEMPTSPVYTGVVDGIWASANGNAYVTEL